MKAKLTRAKAEHVCELCRVRIEKGEKYVARQYYPRETHGYGYVKCRLHRFCEHIMSTAEAFKGRPVSIDYAKELYQARLWAKHGLDEVEATR